MTASEKLEVFTRGLKPDHIDPVTGGNLYFYYRIKEAFYEGYNHGLYIAAEREMEREASKDGEK